MAEYALPEQELRRRLEPCAKLIAVLSVNPKEPTFIIAGRNVDTSYLPQGPGIPPLPVPSIHHSMVDCQLCGDKIWLGPNQMKAKGWRICYLCHGVMLVLDPRRHHMEMRMLNADEAEVPRRTT